MTDRAVTFTAHAMVRLAERSNDPRPELRARREITEALEAGRTAVRTPRWIIENGRTRGAAPGAGQGGRGGTYRWCWNAEQTMAYLLDLSRSSEARVITVQAAT